jgi:predicted esterase
MSPRQEVVRFGVAGSAAAAPPDTLAVLGVHGRTQSPDFVRELAARLGDEQLAWFAPAAPDNSWYPGGFMAPVAENQPALDHALGDLEVTLQQIREAGWTSQRTIVLGFSQGACLSSQLLLAAQRLPCAGAVLLTGGFVGPPGTRAPAGGDWEGRPVFCGLVEDDPWVPLERARDTAQVLAERGADVELRVYPGNVHEVNDDELAATADLLARVRAATVDGSAVQSAARTEKSSFRVPLAGQVS